MAIVRSISDSVAKAKTWKDSPVMQKLMENDRKRAEKMFKAYLKKEKSNIISKQKVV